MKTETCPTCGSRVKIGGKEGETRFFIPIESEYTKQEVEQLLIKFRDDMEKYINGLTPFENGGFYKNWIERNLKK